MTIQNEIHDDFIWVTKAEPHHQRRIEILEKHPEVRKLMGPDFSLVLVTILLVGIQIAAAAFAGKVLDMQYGWILYIIGSYVIGATATQALFLSIHEITHNLAFKKQSTNNLFSFFANIPIVFPYAMSFKAYHTLHHRNQGKDGIDVDIPTLIETKIFRGFLGKVLWFANQIFFYAFRPMAVYPMKIRKWQAYNIVFQIAAVAALFPLIGFSGFGYLLLSIFFAGGIHPCSGHFISEHYVFNDSQETYSYYGPLNMLTLNVGYHNEHHDFPSISFSRLPKLKKLAPEYYDTLFYHTSWTKVIFQFLTRRDIKLTSRVKRK
ncbi:MAG TPA: fatty acid desaturase [Ignavibacteria bacterium]|nr:fatty acid desaturase [Ignavibacteria bacterium]